MTSPASAAVARLSAIHHVALRVADPERSLRFYGELLGLPEARRFEEQGRVRSIWLRAGGAIVMLERELKGRGADAGSGHVLVFAVAETETWEARLAAAGVAIDDRTAATLYVHDPDGHRVGLSVYPLPAAGPA